MCVFQFIARVIAVYDPHVAVRQVGPGVPEKVIVLAAADG